MQDSQGRNKSTLITAAGVFIFLAAGVFTMLFFPDREKTPPNQPASKLNSDSNLSLEIKPLSEEIRQEIKIEIPKPKKDIFVHVVGEVKNPGFYQISADSRIFHAVEKAGGFTDKADQTSVNLASKVTDGFQINVLAKGSKKNQDLNIPARVPGMQVAPNNPVIIRQSSQNQNQNID